MTRTFIANRPTKPFVVIGPSIAYVPLTQGYFAVIDVDSIPEVESRTWSVFGSKKDRTKYAATYPPAGGKLLMHRLLADTPYGKLTDHRNHIGLHNFRANIRSCDSSTNMHNRREQRNNTSGYRGVSYNPQQGTWRAQIKIGGKMTYIGTFPTPEVASAAYEEERQKTFIPVY